MINDMSSVFVMSHDFLGLLCSNVALLRYSLIRDFSTSFALTFMNTPGYPPPPVSLVHIDNNPDVRAVLRDMTDWFPVLIAGGVMSGSQYNKASVQLAVQTFATQNGLQVGLFEDRKTWFIQRQ